MKGSVLPDVWALLAADELGVAVEGGVGVLEGGVDEPLLEAVAGAEEAGGEGDALDEVDGDVLPASGSTYC